MFPVPRIGQLPVIWSFAQEAVWVSYPKAFADAIICHVESSGEVQSPHDLHFETVARRNRSESPFGHHHRHCQSQLFIFVE